MGSKRSTLCMEALLRLTSSLLEILFLERLFVRPLSLVTIPNMDLCIARYRIVLIANFLRAGVLADRSGLLLPPSSSWLFFGPSSSVHSTTPLSSPSLPPYLSPSPHPFVSNGNGMPMKSLIVMKLPVILLALPPCIVISPRANINIAQVAVLGEVH